MQISKTLLVACVGFLCATPVLLRARADSEEQAKARAALEQKMKQMESQQPPAAAPAPKAAPARLPHKAPALQTHVNTNVVVISAPEEGTSPEVYDKLSQAVDKKWQEIETSKAAEPMPTKAAPVPETAESHVYQPLPASVSGKARTVKSTPELTLQKEQEQNTLSSALQTPTTAQGISSYAPLIGPPPPISAAQQKQLNDLLLLYEADRISPEQYHDRRAKILGEH